MISNSSKQVVVTPPEEKLVFEYGLKFLEHILATWNVLIFHVGEQFKRVNNFRKFDNCRQDHRLHPIARPALLPEISA